MGRREVRAAVFTGTVALSLVAPAGAFAAGGVTPP
jgi:hypothetical protein